MKEDTEDIQVEIDTMDYLEAGGYYEALRTKQRKHSRPHLPLHPDYHLTNDYKVVIAGNVIKGYRYNSLVYNNLTEKPLRDKVSLRNFTNTVSANYDQWLNPEGTQRAPTRMLTLTHRDNIMDYDESYNLFNLFMKRLNHDVLGYKQHKIKYSVVPEQQKRGAWHYHVALYNIGFVPQLYSETIRVWNSIKGTHEGYARYSDTSGMNTLHSIKAYLTKYMVKDMSGDNRPGAKTKRYSGSQGLKRSSVFKNKEAITILRWCHDNKVLMTNSAELSDISYREYDLQGKLLPATLFTQGDSLTEALNE